MRRAPVLFTHGTISGVEGVRILKVLEREEAERGSYAPASTLLWRENADTGFAGAYCPPSGDGANVTVSSLRDPHVIAPGDVIRLQHGKSLISVLYRRGANANRLFLTERCNSLCVMCSQPPNSIDDRWRISELHETIDLIDRHEPQLAITGGEPTLLGGDLSALLSHCRERLPETHLHVLTNGREFRDGALAADWIKAGGAQTVWAVPIYADVAPLHDEIVGAAGAFEQTLQGLYELASCKARVEIRIVLHAMSTPRLEQLASYIYRRLPFVEHIAFMGLEPMGLARANREQLWIDPTDYVDRLGGAVHHLAVRGMNPSIYNLPLCVLPQNLRPFARRSISDWKNIDAPECTACAAKDKCSGFFASAGADWRSRAIQPFREMNHELA